MTLALTHLHWPGSESPPKQRTYARTAAIIFAGAALFELGRIVIDLPWRNVPAAASHGVGVVLALLWLSAAVSLLFRDRGPTVLTLSWSLAVAGTLAFVVHGAVTRVFGSVPGIAYVALAIVQTALLKSSFDRGFLQTGLDAQRWARSH